MNVSDLLSNQFIRIVLMIFFFLFVNKILFAIGVFFGIDPNVLNMYFIWLAVIIFLGILLPPEKSRIFKDIKIPNQKDVPKTDSQKSLIASD